MSAPDLQPASPQPSFPAGQMLPKLPPRSARRFPRRELFRLIKGDHVEWDQTLPGFGLRFHPSGRRTWIVFTRIKGVVTKINLGNARVVTETEAKTKAQLLILTAKVRRDPLAAKRQAKETPLFRDFCADYWQKWRGQWKPRTERANIIYRDTQLLPAFGKLFLDQIDEAVVLKWFTAYTEKAPGGANRALGMLNHMFRKAEAWGVLPPHSNPCPAIKQNPRKAFTRFLSEAELKRIGAVLDKLEARNPWRVGAVRVLLYTGCRKSEVLSLRWEDVVGRYMRLRDSKTGERQVDLAEAAQEAFRRIPRIRGNPYVFPNPRARNEPMKDIIIFWRSTVLAKAGIKPLRVHDIRHTFASHAALESENTTTIAKLLGHRMTRTTERYMHLGDKPAIEAAEMVSVFLAAALSGKPIPFANEGKAPSA